MTPPTASSHDREPVSMFFVSKTFKDETLIQFFSFGYHTCNFEARSQEKIVAASAAPSAVFLENEAGDIIQSQFLTM